MEIIKQTLFTGWNFMRWVRLAFGVFFAVQAIQTHDTLVGLVSAFFLLTAISNTGCCGNKSCTMGNVQKNSMKTAKAESKETI
jgi:hypothetical protein